jgi:hypothetical protein
VIDRGVVTGYLAAGNRSPRLSTVRCSCGSVKPRSVAGTSPRTETAEPVPAGETEGAINRT